MAFEKICLLVPGALGTYSRQSREVRRTFFRAAALVSLTGSFGLSPAHAQTTTTVFSDNFDTSEGATFTTSGQIGTSSWSVTRPGNDWGARIDGGILELTNTASAATNANGWAYASAPTSGFTSPWNSTLSSNAGLVSWDFNMRQIRSSPSGFSPTTYGSAFVLGATDTNVGLAGDGYAVVLGNSGSSDPVRLVTFTGGIQSIGAGTGGLISATAPLNNPGNSYMSLRVTYDPITNGWEMFGRNDGTGFADPAVGTLSSLGTTSDSTYTSIPLNTMGGYWNGSIAGGQTAFFDNVSVSVTEAALVSSLYWDGAPGWTATAPGSGGSGTWATGAGGWNSTQRAVFTENGGTVVVDAGGVTADNGIDFEGSGYTLSGGTIAFGSTSNFLSVAAGLTAAIDSVIAGSNGMSKTLAGTLELGGANTFAGNVSVLGGTLVIAADAALGDLANDVVINGTLQTTSSISLDAGRDLSGSGALDIASGTTLTVNGAVAMAGLTLVNAGTLSLQGASPSVGVLTINSPLVLQSANAISATGLTAPGLSAGTATISPAVTLTSGDKTLNVPDAGTLVLQGDMSGLGTSRLIKTGTGTLVVAGELAGGLRIGVAGSTDGGTVVLGQAASIGSNTQLQLNYGTLRTDAAGGLAMTPGLSIGGRDAARAVLGAGEPMSFAGNVSFFGSGSAADMVLEVNNNAMLSGAVSLATSSSITGWTIRGSGDLTLSGTSAGLTAPITLADTVTLNVAGTTANNVSVGSTNVLTGTGTIGGIVGGAGSVQPGASPGILTVGQVDPSSGTSFVLEYTGGLPDYSNATASTNDVIRVTNATPFVQSMTTANTVDVFLGVSSVLVGNSFEGGFFTDTPGDFTASVTNATLNYYVLGNGSGTDATLDGQGYYTFANWKSSFSSETDLALALGTIARTASFTGGNVSGQAMVISAVPEPSTIGLVAAAAGLASAGLLRRRDGLLRTAAH